MSEEPAALDPRRFEFPALVKLLLAAHPGAARPGEAGPPAREPLRFRPTATLAFAASDVEAVETLPAEGDLPARTRVTVNFMGLYGPASPMPNHFTEEILWAGAEGAGARDFVDLFDHRMISFVFRAWEKYRFPEQFRADPPDPFTARMFCLLGLGTRGMREATGIEPLRLLRSGAHLASRHKSALGLECFLRVHFPEAGVRVEPCVRRRVPIPEAERTRLGRRAGRLGTDACLGESVSDRSGAFRIVLGPLDRRAFQDFLPSGEGLALLVRLTRLFVSDPLEFDVTLRLAAPEVPALRLAAARDLRLGQSSWLVPSGREEGRVTLFVRSLEPRPPATRPDPLGGTGARGADAESAAVRPSPGARR